MSEVTNGLNERIPGHSLGLPRVPDCARIRSYDFGDKDISLVDDWVGKHKLGGEREEADDGEGIDCELHTELSAEESQRRKSLDGSKTLCGD